MNRIVLLITGAIFIAVVFTGCHMGGAYAPKNTEKYALENESKFVLLDKGAQRSVTCSGLQERVLPDGRLEVTANVRNRENRRIEVQINCVFKDAQGFPTGDETPFSTLILTENAQEGVKFVSMNDKARGYTIRVRQAR
ncbi:MAG: YcfL family protein [Verrucomicrobia bacterium]|nr:YcfL family protein [Verrucomicrobiota bacterium]MCF7707792.1 YcfL family protein [Verrucomicrobiota bacterium]